MPAPTIFITSACNDLDFLVPVVERFKGDLGENFSQFRICHAADIDNVIERIRQSDAKRIVIFSHGRDGELLGADCPASGEHGPPWMDRSEHLVKLNEKEVFCLACKSVTLANDAVAAGASAFLGFAEVPFHRFDGANPRSEPELEESCKRLIVEAVQLSLLRWLIADEPIVEVAAFFRLVIRRRVVESARVEQAYRDGVIRLSLEMLKCNVVLAIQQ